MSRTLAGTVGLFAALAFILRAARPTLALGDDPLTFVVVAALLAVAAPVACLLPARRAARVDPMTALRWD